MIYPKHDVSYKYTVEPAKITCVYKNSSKDNLNYTMHLKLDNLNVRDNTNYILNLNHDDLLKLSKEYGLKDILELNKQSVMTIFNDKGLSGIVSNEYAKKATAKQLLRDYHKR
ncbi:MAG: hypothetical protein ACOC3X_03190 [Nanoarchaeota archaeon]